MIKIAIDETDVLPQLIAVLGLSQRKLQEIGLANTAVKKLDLTDLSKGT